jgi:hypothetical protein
MPKADAGKAVRVLDLLLEFFGEDGAHWTRGRCHDGHGGGANGPGSEGGGGQPDDVILCPRRRADYRA